jgi:cytochrome c556
MRFENLRVLGSAILAQGLLAGGCLLFAAAAMAGPEADIRYRQAVMKAKGGHMMAIQSIVKGDVPHRGDLLAHAQALAASGDMMTRLFPPGSGTGRTRARPEIWTNAADFKAKLDEYRAASRALASAAQGSDTAAIGAAMARTGRSCKACHDRYQRED